MNDYLKSWLFVLTQAVLLVLLVFFANGATPTHIVNLAGKVIQVIGWGVLLVSFYDLRKSLTALPMPTKHGALQIHGLYRFVRHPMYVGVLTLSLGIAVAGGGVQKYALVLALYILFRFKARYEETLLVAKYPSYQAYMHKTGRFIPRLRRG